MSFNDTIQLNLENNRSSWMKMFLKNKKFGLKHLSEIVLPGTHNSASYTVENILTSIHQCQLDTITQQLNSGIRFLDFRVCDDSRSTSLSVSHYFCGTDFSPLLKEVQLFLLKNTQEILIVSIKKDWDRKLSQSGYEELKALILGLFNNMIITKQEMETKTILELINNNKRIHFVSPILKDNPIFSSCIQDSWPTTKSDRISQLLTNLNEFKFEDRKGIKLLDCYITPEIESIIKWKTIKNKRWRNVQEEANIGICFWLKENLHKKKINTVSVDLFTQEIVDTIIKVNLHENYCGPI